MADRQRCKSKQFLDSYGYLLLKLVVTKSAQGRRAAGPGSCVRPRATPPSHSDAIRPAPPMSPSSTTPATSPLLDTLRGFPDGFGLHHQGPVCWPAAGGPAKCGRHERQFCIVVADRPTFYRSDCRTLPSRQPRTRTTSLVTQEVAFDHHQICRPLNGPTPRSVLDIVAHHRPGGAGARSHQRAHQGRRSTEAIWS